MIDVHCHLEQRDYDNDREEVIERARVKRLIAIITCCANPRDLDKTLDIVRRYRGFVYATASVHPEYVKEFDEEIIDRYFTRIRENVDLIVGIGETGLDYYWVTDPEWRVRQQELFRRHIRFAESLEKPVVIHSRDSHSDIVEILEEENAKRVHWHMFGAKELLNRVIDNSWFVSLNAIVFKSKKYRKVARDVPLDRLMLETDAPWLALEKSVRNEPTTIIDVARKIAEIKKISFDEVWFQAGRNAVEFYGLDVKIV